MFGQMIKERPERKYAVNRDFQPLSQYSIILSELADGEKTPEQLIEITGFFAPSVRRVLSELNSENLIHKVKDSWCITV